MQPTPVDIEIQGDLGGRKVAMKFDENSIAHIMSVLTDLYSDPELAVIREYSTNAWDSHIAAGVTDPIEVTLPTALSPFLRIKDYGIGLSVDDIVDIYSKYGASTKRDSNEQTGILGLGCKSALTYTNQFQLVSVQEGAKVTVAVSRTEDGTGIMEIVDTVSTDERNGVEIIVPAKRHNDFASTAASFFYFWKPGTVLVNGSQPTHFQGDQITSELWMNTNWDFCDRQDYIVMGGVSYPVEGGIYQGSVYSRNYSIIAFVPIGSVNFTPSRESLHYTQRTKNTIERLRNEFTASVKAKAQADVASAPDHYEALKRAHHWTASLGARVVGSFTYKGELVPDRVTVSNVSYRPMVSYRQYLSRSSVLMLSTFFDNHSIVIDGLIDPSSYQKQKIKKWLAENKPEANSHTVVVAVPQWTPSNWVDPARIVSWEEIKKISLADPNKVRVSTKRTHKYDVYNSSTCGYDLTDDLDTKNPILYITPADKISYAHLNTFLAAVPNATIVSLGKNRWDRLKKDYPTARGLHEYISERFLKAKNAVAPKDYRYLRGNQYEDNVYSQLDASKIKDPAVRDYVTFIQEVRNSKLPKSVVQYKQWLGIRRIFHIYDGHALIDPPEIKNPIRKKYPLADARYMEHTYLYMNAVYETERKKNDQV